MNTKSITVHIFTLATLALPMIALAHGGEEDGHVEDLIAEIPKAGASALLTPWSPAWFGLLAVSTLITALLCYGVYRYIQVAPVVMNKPEVTPEKK